MNALELTTSITVTANALAQGLSLTELAVLAAIFVQIGDTLATVAAQRALDEELSAQKKE